MYGQLALKCMEIYLTYMEMYLIYTYNTSTCTLVNALQGDSWARQFVFKHNLMTKMHKNLYSVESPDLIKSYQRTKYN